MALVTETFYPRVDGTTATVRALVDRLVDRGTEVLLVAPAPGLCSHRGATVARVRPADRPGRQVRAALERFGPDLVHVTSPGVLGRKALKHARALGVPTVVSQQSPLPDREAARWPEKVAARADAVVATAPWLVDRLAALGTPAGLWTPGVDAAAFTPALHDRWLHARWAGRSGLHPGAPGGAAAPVVVGFVGALRRRHDVRRLAELADLPGPGPGHRLVVVGDGPQRRWLEDRLPGARFTGALHGGDLATAVASLDVLVHPATDLTCAHALREAAASAVPVVAARAGGAPTVVRDHETGVLFEPAARFGLVDAVASVVADPRRAQLGARARELALSRSWHDAVDELVERTWAGVLDRAAAPARVAAARGRGATSEAAQEFPDAG